MWLHPLIFIDSEEKRLFVPYATFVRNFCVIASENVSWNLFDESYWKSLWPFLFRLSRTTFVGTIHIVTFDGILYYNGSRSIVKECWCWLMDMFVGKRCCFVFASLRKRS